MLLEVVRESDCLLSTITALDPLRRAQLEEGVDTTCASVTRIAAIPVRVDG